MGTKSAIKCHQSLWSHNPIPLDIFLGSLSIPLVATVTIKKLIDSGFSNVESIFNLSMDDLLKIKGLGPSKSKQIIEGLKRNKSIIDGLLEEGIAILEPTSALSNKLLGYKICITGSTLNKRDALKKMIIDNAGEYKDKVSKDCTHLIIADVNSTSSKALAAKSLGIALISENDFLELIE
jgi:DNA ligase (NAD+)